MSHMTGRHRRGGCGLYLLGLFVAILATVLLSGCGSDTHKSAPEVDCKATQAAGQPKTCTTPKTIRVIQNPEGFRNVLISCDEFGTGLYVTSRGELSSPVASDIAIYPHDPSCPQPKTSPSAPQ